MLHLVSTIDALDTLSGRISPGDDIVLQGSSVSATRSGHRKNPSLASFIDDQCGVHAMSDTLKAFGIAPSQMIARISRIDYDDLVDLTVKHPVIHTWA